MGRRGDWGDLTDDFNGWMRARSARGRKMLIFFVYLPIQPHTTDTQLNPKRGKHFLQLSNGIRIIAPKRHAIVVLSV